MSSTARPDAQRLHERRARCGVGLRDRRGNQQRDRRQEQQACLQPGARAVELLHVVLEAAEQERRAQHEQRVGDDRAGDRRLHQRVLPGAQGGERDDQLGQVAERRVEQPADRVAGLRGHRLGGVAQQGGERHDGQDRQHEEQCVRLGLELVRRRTPRARRPAARAADCGGVQRSSCFMTSCSNRLRRCC